MGDRADATRFFYELEQFSERYARQELGCELRVQHGGPKPDRPWRGAVIHYTADEDLDRVIRWFMNPASNVSAHVVVSDRKLGCHDGLAAGLELVKRLPVTGIQCRHPGQGAWHARWANERCYGVECVSAGLLKADGRGNFYSWRARDGSGEPWTMPWTVPYKDVTELYGKHWVRYPGEQVAAVITVLRRLFAMGEPFALPSRPWVVGHSAVQLGKFDPGPDFPIHELRAALWDDWRPPTDYSWWEAFNGDHKWGKRWRDASVVAAVKVLAGRRKGDKDPGVETAWTRARSAWSAMPDNWRESTGWIKLGLHLLGYAVTTCGAGDFADVGMDTDDHTSVGIFQQAMGLKVDSIPGPITTRALNVRLRDMLGEA